jgi:hypothetical protein
MTEDTAIPSTWFAKKLAISVGRRSDFLPDPQSWERKRSYAKYACPAYMLDMIGECVQALVCVGCAC